MQEILNSKGLNPQPEWARSMVSFSGKKFNYYCIKDSLSVLNTNTFITLNCYAAKLPYSLDYFGPPTLEKEAESIFESIE